MFFFLFFFSNECLKCLFYSSLMCVSVFFKTVKNTHVYIHWCYLCNNKYMYITYSFLLYCVQIKIKPSWKFLIYVIIQPNICTRKKKYYLQIRKNVHLVFTKQYYCQFMLLLWSISWDIKMWFLCRHSAALAYMYAWTTSPKLQGLETCCIFLKDTLSIEDEKLFKACKSVCWSVC